MHVIVLCDQLAYLAIYCIMPCTLSCAAKDIWQHHVSSRKTTLSYHMHKYETPLHDKSLFPNSSLKIRNPAR